MLGCSLPYLCSSLPPRHTSSWALVGKSKVVKSIGNNVITKWGSTLSLLQVLLVQQAQCWTEQYLLEPWNWACCLTMHHSRGDSRGGGRLGPTAQGLAQLAPLLLLSPSHPHSRSSPIPTEAGCLNCKKWKEKQAPPNNLFLKNHASCYNLRVQMKNEFILWLITGALNYVVIETHTRKERWE